MSLEDIRRKAKKFQSRIVWRNVRESLAALIAVIMFSWNCWRTDDMLTRVGYVLMISGLFYLVWHLFKQGSARQAPAGIGMTSSVDHFRQELVRQRNLVASVATWYLGPVMPGWVVLMIAFVRTNPGHLRRPALYFSTFNVVAVLFFIFVWWLNQRSARRLQRQIDELDGLRG